MENRTIANTKTCPVCGSDMSKDKTHSPHDKYTEKYTCQNRDCNISTTVRN